MAFTTTPRQRIVCVVQELLGHVDLETTATYLHSDTRANETAVGLIANLTGSVTS